MKNVEMVIYTPHATVKSLTETLHFLMFEINGIKDAKIESVRETVSGNDDYYVKKEVIPYWSVKDLKESFTTTSEGEVYRTGFRVVLTWKERLF